MSNAVMLRNAATRRFSAFKPAKMRTISTVRNCSLQWQEYRSTSLGEFIDPITSSASLGLYGSLVGAAALGMFAIWQSDSENDDDDSTPGGGLMQPIA